MRLTYPCCGRPWSEDSARGFRLPRIAAFALLAGLFLFVLCASSNSVSAAEIYLVRGKGGVITFTSRKPDAGTFETLRSKRPAYSVFIRSKGQWKVKPMKSSYDDIIRSAAVEFDLDPALAKAVIHAESGFNPKALSPKGAMGLMQLMPATAKRFGVTNAYHPEKNVYGGIKYLSTLLQRYSGNERLAVAAYNAGEGAVDPIMAIPPYRETQTYVKRVLKLRELYSCVDSGKSGCPSSVFVD